MDRLQREKQGLQQVGIRIERTQNLNSQIRLLEAPKQAPRPR